MNNETDETKKAFEAFEVYLDLDAQLKGAEAEVSRLKYLQLVQKKAIGDALGIFEGEYVFTSSDGSTLIVEIDEYRVKELRLVAYPPAIGLSVPIPSEQTLEFRHR